MFSSDLHVRSNAFGKKKHLCVIMLLKSGSDLLLELVVYYLVFKKIIIDFFFEYSKIYVWFGLYSVSFALR